MKLLTAFISVIFLLSHGAIAIADEINWEQELDEEVSQLSYEVSSTSSSTRDAWGIHVFSYYSGADSLSTTANSLNSTSGSLPIGISQGEFATTPGFGLGVEHSMVRLVSTGPVHFGYQAGGAYEFGRTIERVYADSSSEFVVYEGPTISFFEPYANALVNYQNAYAFGGINYSIPLVSGARNDESYSGNIGFQTGVGFAITPMVLVEAMYRTVNFNVAANNVNKPGSRDSQDRDGLGVLADESLSLSGLNLNLKLRF